MTHAMPEHSGVQPSIQAQAPISTDEGRGPSFVAATRSVPGSGPRATTARVIGAGIAAGVVFLAGVFSFGGLDWRADAVAATESTAVLAQPEPAFARAEAQPQVDVLLSKQVPSVQPPPVATPVPAPVVVALPEWVRNTETATLWSHAQESSSKELAELPDGSRLMVISQQDGDRALVYCADPAPEGEAIAGWVDRTQLEPAESASRVTTSSRGGERTAPDTEDPVKFIASVLEAAQESEERHKVPTSVILAQAIIESGWGRSGLAESAHNYFGIKANKPGPAGVVNMNTMEVESGASVMTTAGFKAYNNAVESFLDHGQFLSENPRYKEAFKTTDPREFVRRVHAAGYATDPDYTSKLIGTMDHYDLYRYNAAETP